MADQHTLEVAIRTTIDGPWLGLDPIRIGSEPSGLGTPDAYATVQQDGLPYLRVDIYLHPGAFTEAHVHGRSVLIGFGDHAFVVQCDSRSVTAFPLEGYFGAFCLSKPALLIASACRLWRITPAGDVIWKSDDVGIDGVIVEAVTDRWIDGQGEWDPPGGWRPFRVDVRTGKTAPRP